MEEESDIEDRVASEYDEDLDEYDSEESGLDDANGLLDMEAAESDGESENLDDTSPTTGQFFFPQFKSLPPELRARIWEFFDSDLRTKARVFQMILMISPIEFWESATLIEQTAPARAMLATHQESRELALKSYPDTLDLHRGRGVIRYNSERDIVLLSISSILGSNDLEEFFSSLGNTKYLAFNHLRAANEEILYPRLAAHPTLKEIFYCYDCYELSYRHLMWCRSDSVLRFYSQQTDYDTVLDPRPLRSMFCWPDLENHRKFAEEHALSTVGDLKPLKIWTMVEFAFDQGFSRYERLEALGEGTEGWSSDTDSEPNSDSASEDEYESEGIDDATIASDDSSNENEDDLVVQSDSDEDNLSTFDGFSPTQDENPELHLDGEIEVGNFSSLEPESPSHHDNASEQDGSDEEPVQKITRRKRRIVSSDDEGNPTDERDEEVNMPSRPAKRSRVVLSDTEDERDVDGDEDTKQGRDIAYELEESEEPEDGDPVKTESMSLFEKLRQYRQENPVPPDSDASSDIEASMGSEGLDTGNNINFPDDEVEDEDELSGDGGIAADMSEEHSEGDEYDEDGW